MKKRIIVICGPTAIGKTNFAIWIAKKFNGEIIGADSMQVYRHMDIGTAKPDSLERKMAVHHMIDIADPDEEFDAVKFTEMADKAIERIIKKGKIPVVAGGTGFYIKALLHGLFRQGRAADKDIISRLEMEAGKTGSAFFHKKLEKIDPDSAERIHPNDAFRIIRALEVFESTGRTMTSFHREHRFASNRYISLKLGLYMDRTRLYKRIEERVDAMINNGLINEVESLIEMGYSCRLKSMQSLGYRHICDFLNNGVSFEDTVVLLKRDTRRYAKRQFTWFGKDEKILWLQPHEKEKAERYIINFFQLSKDQEVI